MLNRVRKEGNFHDKKSTGAFLRQMLYSPRRLQGRAINVITRLEKTFFWPVQFFRKKILAVVKYRS